MHTEELISLESLLLAGQKKVPKIYAIAVHPLQPHIVAVGANAGPTWHRPHAFILHATKGCTALKTLMCVMPPL